MFKNNIVNISIVPTQSTKSITKINNNDTNNQSRVIEQGDIFFFYRPKIEAEKVKVIEDVQRFYMVMCPEGDKRRDICRLFLIGQKQLPKIIEGKSHPSERNWALNILTTSNPEEIRKEILVPAEYTTETRGKRRLAAAVPIGEGKYSIVRHNGHTELAYILELPKIPGPAQKEFEIKREASYLISVKNPNIAIPGFAAISSSTRRPNYPKHIMEKFGNRRWINVDDPDLLNYENTQLLLIGARKKDVEEELGIDIDEKKQTEESADIFRELKIRKEQVPLTPLLKGEFPKEEEVPFAQEVKKLSKEEMPGKGGKKGGKVAATKAASAAALAKLLGGIDFPANKDELIEYAMKNKPKVKSAEEIIEIIKQLPSRRNFNTMVDVEKALGEIS